MPRTDAETAHGRGADRVTRRSAASRPAPSRDEQLASAIEAWFEENQRPLPWRETYDPYQVWISEVMLQQTRMEVVLPYFRRFVERFPTVRDLASAEESDVLAAWSGLGYYRRAGMLHVAAKGLVANAGGSLPRELKELRSIPGIGRYTAGAISSIAFERRAPIVDGNVTRLLARINAFEGPAGTRELEAELWAAAERLVGASASPRSFNQGMMELAATICTPRAPACDDCPVSDLCSAHSFRAETSFPRAGAAKTTRPMTVDLFVVRRGDGSILLRREEGALMRGMYHLPQRGELFPSPKLAIRKRKRLGQFRHTITERRITFVVFGAELKEEIAESGERFVWVGPEDLVAVPHPSYVRKALEL